VTLAPITSSSSTSQIGAPPSRTGSPRSHAEISRTSQSGHDDRVHLPSLTSAVPSSSSSLPPQHHPSFAPPQPNRIFDSQTAPSTSTSTAAAQQRSRRESVSSASPSISGSSEGGIRSPEAPAPRTLAGWGGAASNAIASLNALSANGGGSTADERRGRPEKRFEEYGSVGKGKGREQQEDGDDMLEEVDELEEDEGMYEGANSRGGLPPPEQNRRMDGVQTGLNELRVSVASPQLGRGGQASGVRMIGNNGNGSSRSRSGVRGESERGRSRVIAAARGGSTSTSRARGSSSASGASSSRNGGGSNASLVAGSRDNWPPEALAEIARLKTKISELTFLNGLMQSRLGQLDAGVPRRQVTSMTAETPRPDAYEPDDEEDGVRDGEGGLERMEEDPIFE